ncbi:hypothetical protein EZS27_007742 [termite gut metagenome]|uniref:Outer membrane protein beta-barrel domain-containing protein n=1 Tax=termite gut metagenome TaxID=433724 RepID=A0A5J4SFU8_9ZZZZ
MKKILLLFAVIAVTLTVSAQDYKKPSVSVGYTNLTQVSVPNGLSSLTLDGINLKVYQPISEKISFVPSVYFYFGKKGYDYNNAYDFDFNYNLLKKNRLGIYGIFGAGINDVRFTNPDVTTEETKLNSEGNEVTTTTVTPGAIVKFTNWKQNAGIGLTFDIDCKISLVGEFKYSHSAYIDETSYNVGLKYAF